MVAVCGREGRVDAHRYGRTGVEREEESCDWVWSCDTRRVGTKQFFFLKMKPHDQRPIIVPPNYCTLDIDGPIRSHCFLLASPCYGESS